MVENIITCEMISGIKTIRPDFVLQFKPPEPPTKLEIMMNGAKIGIVIATCVVAIVTAFIWNPILFASCFAMGLMQGLMVMARSKS